MRFRLVQNKFASICSSPSLSAYWIGKKHTPYTLTHIVRYTNVDNKSDKVTVSNTLQHTEDSVNEN